MERCGSRLSRRQFVGGAAGLGLVAGCGRLPGQAEAPAKVPRIGVLAFVTADPSAADNAAFRQGLRDLGYSEGQNITLEWRASSSGVNQYPELAADLVGLSVDLIVAQGNVASQAAKQASVTIPVVMAYSPDPVRNGFVASLARPGGNVTGLASLTGHLGASAWSCSGTRFLALRAWPCWGIRRLWNGPTSSWRLPPPPRRWAWGSSRSSYATLRTWSPPSPASSRDGPRP